MKKFINSFVLLLFLFSLFICFLSYLNIDPIKSCLLLILSLIFISPVLSLGNQIWFRYYVCLIFLSGIFVILVYFSRLSKYNFFNHNLSFLVFIGFLFFPFLLFKNNLLVYVIYFRNNFLIIFWVIFSLLLFMNFTSYFLNFSGALRKI